MKPDVVANVRHLEVHGHQPSVHVVTRERDRSCVQPELHFGALQIGGRLIDRP
jgi:hypothetical protein